MQKSSKLRVQKSKHDIFSIMKIALIPRLHKCCLTQRHSEPSSGYALRVLVWFNPEGLPKLSFKQAHIWFERHIFCLK